MVAVGCFVLVGIGVRVGIGVLVTNGFKLSGTRPETRATTPQTITSTRIMPAMREIRQPLEIPFLLLVGVSEIPGGGVCTERYDSLPGGWAKGWFGWDDGYTGGPCRGYCPPWGGVCVEVGG